MEVEDHQYTFVEVPPGYDGGHDCKVRDPNPYEGEYIPIFEQKFSNYKRLFSINLDSQIREEESISDLGLSDFNGDGKTDLLIPISEGSFAWNLYISTGNGFIKKGINNLALYKPHERKGNKRNGIRGDVERKYFIQDLT